MLHMPGYFVRNLLSVLIAVTLLATAQEPVKPKLHPRIITATRQAQIFIDLEMQMLRTIREMSVVDLGNAAVVKFERRQEAVYKGSAVGGEFFIVDVWKKDSDKWKLANRFVSRSSATSAAPKGPV